MAMLRRKPARKVLHHSDRGSQYAGDDYQSNLTAFGLTCSMSRVGNCWDNAVMERVWAALKTELVYQRNFKTKQGVTSFPGDGCERW